MDLACPRCGYELESSNVECIGLASGSDLVPAALDILVTCPECETKLNGFLPVNDLKPLF